MKSRNIQTRLWVVGAVVIVAIIGATGLIVKMQREASIEAFRVATLNLGRGMAQQTTQPLAAADRALQAIQTGLVSSASTSAPFNTTAGLKATRDLLVDQRNRLSQVNALYLVDTLGKTVSASGERPPTGTDVSARDFFRYLSEEDDQKLFVGGVVRDAESGKSSVAMARRLNNAQGQFAGIVVADISIEDLTAFYRLAMPPRRSVYLLRSDGLVLLCYPAGQNETGGKVPQGSPWYGAVAQGGGTYYANDFLAATPVVAAVQPLRNLPFVVEASVTEADALSDWYRQRTWVVLGGAAACICTVVLLHLFARQYRRVELSELTLAAKNAQLDAAHRQLDVTLANLSQGVCFFDNNMKLLVRNRRYCELYDLPEDAVTPGMSLAEISALRLDAGSLPYQTVEAAVAATVAIMDSGKPVDVVRELANGRTVTGHFEPLPGQGWILTYDDITERRAAEAKIEFLARHDVLTGLANRALFQERLEQAMALAERGMGFALFCLDLDRFKAVNDTLGHPVGDALLCAVAGRLQEVVRESDTVARLGGDEFAILLLAVTEVVEITDVARRIVATIGEPYSLAGHQVSVGTSVGIAMAPGDSANPTELMKDADLALYRAKQEGRQTWRFFEPAMDAVARKRRALEIDLRQAVRLGQFELHYQPIVTVTERRLTGFEALLRWHHPVRGLVLPDDFLAVAEEAGLIGDIGAWVVQQVCAEAMTWPDHLRVAVNLSPRQFRGRTLVGTLADAIQTCGLAPERLQLEFTEAVPLRDDQAALTMLQDLQALGVGIALDNFGTGSSSLSYLRAFPFDMIKLDRSLIADLLTSQTTVAVLRGIIGLAASLQMTVTVKGVETAPQINIIAALGCNEMQGFLISRPVPSGEVEALIRHLDSRQLSSAPALGNHQATAGLVG